MRRFAAVIFSLLCPFAVARLALAHLVNRLGQIGRNAAIHHRMAPMSARRNAGFVPGRVAPPHPRRWPTRPMNYRRITY